MKGLSIMNIINLTQHNATEAQTKDDVFEPSDKVAIKTLLTFTSIPSKEEMQKRAEALAEIASESKAEFAMVGGAAYFIPVLEKALNEAGVKPIHSFTERKSVDKTLENGGMQKVSMFEHIGWVGL